MYPEKEGTDYDKNIRLPDFNQVSTGCASPDEAAQVIDKIRERFGEFLNPLQNGTCIDIVPVGMDKAQGIYKLLEICGGNADDVIAVGDNVNDEAMIKEFYSYAMENGVDAIKAVSDKITVSITDLIEREI